MTTRIRLNRAGIVAVLKSAEAEATLRDAAEGLAARIQPTSHGQPVRVTTATHQTPVTAAASVTIAHPGGLAMEAKHGYMKGAARSAGLTVKRAPGA